MKAFLTLLLAFCFLMTTAQSIKVMTYNIRLDVASDGVNQWGNRKEKVFSLLKKYDPDFIGIQEALHHQLTDIKTNLPQYESIGVGREDGKEKGEYSAILYMKDKFEVLEQSTAWLSLTPEIPGSKSWDAAITRIVTWGRFKNKKSGKTFLIFNTHFDHMGVEARKNSATLLGELIPRLCNLYREPCILSGDFNAEKSEATYSNLTGIESLRDSRPASESGGTFCSFEVNSITCKAIDYIFVSDRWTVKKYSILRDNDGKYYPSDHLPVMITATAK